MILYHLDRAGNLPATGRLELFPLSDLPKVYLQSKFFSYFSGGVSKFCLSYFDGLSRHINSIFLSNCEEALFVRSFLSAKAPIDTQVIEFTYELVRRLHFPQMPSRLTSFFAVDHPALLTQHQQWGFPITNKSRLFALTAPDDTPKFDANLLRGGIVFGGEPSKHHMGALLPCTYDSAYQYWSGQATPNPKWEYLIQLPADLPRQEIPIIFPFEEES